MSKVLGQVAAENSVNGKFIDVDRQPLHRSTISS